MERGYEDIYFTGKRPVDRGFGLSADPVAQKRPLILSSIFYPIGAQDSRWNWVENPFHWGYGIIKKLYLVVCKIHVGLLKFNI